MTEDRPRLRVGMSTVFSFKFMYVSSTDSINLAPPYTHTRARERKSLFFFFYRIEWVVKAKYVTYLETVTAGHLKIKYFRFTV